MHKRGWIGIGAVVLLLFAVGAALAQDDPQLVNGNFDGAFTVRDAGEVVVAEGWVPAWLQGDDRQCPAPCHRPEFKPEVEGDICQTAKCQRWFTTFARQFASIYQRVRVEQGAWYEFSCDVYSISEPDGQMSAMVGIQPWGGDVFGRQMIWGQEYAYQPYRTWTRVSVTAQAWGGEILVVLGGNNQWPTKNNAVYWDNCRLERVEFGGEPLPTYTPAPGGSCPTIQEIETAIADRPPVRWP